MVHSTDYDNKKKQDDNANRNFLLPTLHDVLSL